MNDVDTRRNTTYQCTEIRDIIHGVFKWWLRQLLDTKQYGWMDGVRSRFR